jgi:pimeloyl-ACP methyl ester carboxylesterase
MFEGIIEVPGAKLWGWDTAGDGDAIVLCHPRSQSCQVWASQRDPFAEAGYRVIAYSRRGTFRSDPVSRTTPGSQVADLAALLDARGIACAHLLGAAAGGITATGFAVAYPERTLSLMLAGSIVSPDEDDWREMFSRLGIRQLKDVVPTEFLELGPSYRISDPEGVARFAAGEHEATQPDPGCAQPLGAHVTWAGLERITTPTLLLTGEADLWAPPPLHALVAKHLSDVRLETMRAVGHAPYWEAPEAFNRIVLGFMQEAATETGRKTTGTR